MGKVALIERLTDGLDCQHDDCAVLGNTLVSTQTMVEGVDFDMMYTPLKHLGYKALAIAISNIAAMNGTPRHALVSIAVSNRYSVEALDELYAGMRLCCDRYGVQLAGGETATSRAGMVLTVTALGEVREGKTTYRHGASHNDLICCSGDLGSAYAGLLVLEREAFIPEEKFGAWANCKLYHFSPDAEVPKHLVHEWKTDISLFHQDFANYEGMCLGPRLADGSQVILLVADSQHRYMGVLSDWFKTLVVRKAEDKQ